MDEKSGQFLRDLADLLEVGVDTLDVETSIGEYLWDSMAVLAAIALIDETYGVSMEVEPLQSCRTVGELLAHIRSTGAQ